MPVCIKFSPDDSDEEDQRVQMGEVFRLFKRDVPTMVPDDLAADLLRTSPKKFKAATMPVTPTAPPAPAAAKTADQAAE